MSVTVMNRDSLTANPYYEWLADCYDGKFVVLTSREKLRADR